jgi:hypothetical protein
MRGDFMDLRFSIIGKSVSFESRKTMHIYINLNNF